MADYDCEYCINEKECKYAYESTTCEFNVVARRDSNYLSNLRNCITIIRQSVEQLNMFDEEEDLDDEISSLNFTLNMMESKVDEELENEWKEMIKRREQK